MSEEEVGTANKWHEQVRCNGIHEAIQNFDAALAEARNLAGSQSALDYILRFEFLRAKVKRALDEAEPYLLTPAILNSLTAPFQGMTGHLRQFANDRDESQLRSANSDADNLVSLIRSYSIGVVGDRTLPTDAELERFHETIRGYISVYDSRLENLTGSIKDVETERATVARELEGLRESIGNEKSRISEWHEQYLATQAARAQDFQASLQRHKDDFETFKTKLKSELDENSAEWEKHFKALSEGGSSHIEKLEEHLNKAEEIVGVLTRTSFAGSYKQAANWDFWLTYLWRCVALVATVAICWLAFDLLWLADEAPTVDWRVLLTRALTLAPILLIVRMAANWADAHSRREVKNRQRELELVTIDPYLQSLDSDKVKELKAELVGKYFGTRENGEDIVMRVEEAARADRGFLHDIIKTLIDAVLKR